MGARERRRTIVSYFVRVVKRLCDIGKVRPKGELVDDVREVHDCRISSGLTVRSRASNGILTSMIRMLSTGIPMPCGGHV